MKLRVSLVSMVVVAACAAEPPEAPEGPEPAPAPAASIVEGRVIVTLRDAYDGRAPITLGGRRLTPITHLPSGTWLMQLDDGGGDTIDAIDQLTRAPGVLSATPDRRLVFSYAPSDPETRPANDGRQVWSLAQIRMYEAWDHTLGSAQIRIGLIDSGVRPHLDELDGKWLPGHDFVDNDANPADDGDWAHGTHVAGIVGAIHNASGGAGLCRNCKLVPIRVAPVASQIEQAVHWAAGEDFQATRADVINLSINDLTITDCNDPAYAGIRTEIARAVARGVVVVVSAGNRVLSGPNPTPTPRPLAPATCPGAIAVMASDSADHIPDYSTRGLGADLVAPGGGGDQALYYGAGVGCPTAITGTGRGGVFSTWSYRPTSTTIAACYRHLSGTSMAAPHVTGTVALMRSLRADLTPARIRAVLKLTAVPDGHLPTAGFYCVEPLGCGAGRLDAAAAVSAVDPATTASPAIASIDPPQRDFGTIAPGGSSITTFTLTNLGYATLTSTGAMHLDGTSDWFSFAGGALPFSLAPGASTNVAVRCTPTGGGTQTAELVIPSNTVGQVRVQLWCTSTGVAHLSVPASLGFGDVRRGRDLDVALTVSNPGTATLVVSSATVTGTAFSTQTGLPLTVAPHGQATLWVRCTPPTATTTFTGNLALSSNGGSADVALTCRGVAPVLEVAPAAIDFGEVRVFQRRDRTLTVHNAGTAYLTVAAAPDGLGFSIIGGQLPPLPPDASGTYTVRCEPTADAPMSGAIVVTSDGGDLTVPLGCRGYLPVMSAPGWVDLPDVVVNTSSIATVALRNTGTGPLTVIASGVTGADFALASAVPPTIAAGATANVDVRCTAYSAGYRTGSLIINHDGSGAGQTVVGLGCYAALGRAVITSPSTDPVHLVPGAWTQFTLQNTGIGPVLLDALMFQGDGYTAADPSSPLPYYLPPGASFSWRVTCDPLRKSVPPAVHYVKNHGAGANDTRRTLSCGG